MKKNLIVKEEDIEKIGHTVHLTDSGVAFYCTLETVNIEIILLRSILKCFGDYEITEESDFGDDCIKLQTNLPGDLYKERFMK